MNVTDYTYLMNKPDAITEKQADALGSVLNEFPYFQSARALRLKGLYNQNSFKYNYALKVTAAHTSDRSVLFDFITSEAFTSIQNDFYEQKLRDLLQITVFDSEIISPEQIQKAIEIKTDIEEEPISSVETPVAVEAIKVEEFVKTEEPVKIEEIIKAEEPIKVEESVITEETKNIPEIDPSIFLAIKEAQTITFEKPITAEEPKKITEIDPSIFLAIKEAHSVIYEKPIIEAETKIDTEESVTNLVEETETLPEIEPVKTEEVKIDRVENSILSSIKEAETPSIPESIKQVEEPKFDRIQNSILSSIKEAENIIPQETVKTEEPKTDPVFEQTILNTIEEDEDEGDVIEEMIIPEFKINPIERSILSSIKEAETAVPKENTEETHEEIKEEILETASEVVIDKIEEEQVEEETNQFAKTAAEHLELGKPLDFSLNEKHSFQEWLQLSRTEPIDRSNEVSPEEKAKIEAEREEERQKKAEIINKFIETNPKISPIKPGTSAPAVQIESTIEDNSYLMTETLARVYLEQKKYTKAIQAYEILILKYPEKITFFADRISDIKILQQNNNNNN
ncbi:tetratricopeptide repeat protein [Flavobacterium notoginsengisoli]|uniref:tetratricopeptide repeat protein n=1 Tax=Flavobacterium notoginsengisoli TaxID=1478199 RepID=UPI003642E306